MEDNLFSYEEDKEIRPVPYTSAFYIHTALLEGCLVFAWKVDHSSCALFDKPMGTVERLHGIGDKLTIVEYDQYVFYPKKTREKRKW